MNTRLGFVVLGAVMLFLVGCAAGEKEMTKAGLQPLTGAELQKLFGAGPRAGKWVSVSNNSGTIKYSPSGDMSASWVGGRGGSDTGKWRIIENAMCSKWQRIRRGEERCSRLYNTKGRVYRFYNSTSGAYNTELTLEN